MEQRTLARRPRKPASHLPQRLTRRILREECRPAEPLQVDREHGIILGVKVLGLQSRNGRRYLAEAVKAAIPLYSGVLVNIDHPEKSPTQSRSAYDRFGKLINVRWVEGEGLYADLEYLKSHPMAERICEAAERMSDAFGLSHNAQGDGTTDTDGTFIVRKITEVRHVDLVADPATTTSLSESEDPMKTKLMRRRLPEAGGAMQLDKLEADDDVLADEPAPLDMPAEPEGDWKQDLVAAISKLVGSEDEADHKMAGKIMAMLKPASAAPAPVEEADDEEDEEKDVKESSDALRGKNKDGQVRAIFHKDTADPAVKQLQEELAALQREKAVREECEAAGLNPPKDLFEALLDIPDPKRRKVFLERERKLVAASNRGGPRSQAPASGHGARDSKGFLEAITA